MTVDRDDPAAARAVVERLCPDAAQRRFLMRRLLDSIAVAERAGPQSWAVTLFEDGWRLNVGQVEALTCFHRLVRVFLLGAPPAAAYTVGEILPCQLRSVPAPQHIFYGSVGEVQRLHGQLAGLHAAFVEAAAVTVRGRPRVCGYRRTNSPGLYRYALQQAGVLAVRRARR